MGPSLLFALPGQQLRWGQQMPERELELALEAKKQILRVLPGANKRLSPSSSRSKTTITYLRRFFDDACFFFFSPANLCRGLSSPASSSSS